MRPTLALILGTALACHALDVRAQDIPPPPPPNDADELIVKVVPYAWLAGVSGPAEVTPALPKPEVDSDSGGIFDNLNFFGFAVGEFQKGRWGAVVDVAYVDFTFDKDMKLRDAGPVLASGELDLKGAVTTLQGTYRIEPAEDVDIDLMMGTRIFWLDLGLEVDGPLGGVVASGEISDTWADFLTGARVRWTPGRWTLTAQGDIGAGSDTSDWGAFLAADYRFTDHFGAMVGYRWLNFDYGKGRRDVDLTLDGPVIGMSWTF